MLKEFPGYLGQNLLAENNRVTGGQSQEGSKGKKKKHKRNLKPLAPVTSENTEKSPTLSQVTINLPTRGLLTSISMEKKRISHPQRCLCLNSEPINILGYTEKEN